MNQRKRDDANDVFIPSYEDRTLPVESTVLRRLLRRWAPLILVAALVIVGPFAGGWYHAKNVAASERAAILKSLSEEIGSNIAELERQARVINRVSHGDFRQLSDISPAFHTSRWEMVAGRLDVSETAAADFYDGLTTIEAQYRPLWAAVERARWTTLAGLETVEAARADVLAIAGALNTSLMSQAQQGRALIGRLSSE